MSPISFGAEFIDLFLSHSRIETKTDAYNTLIKHRYQGWDY